MAHISDDILVRVRFIPSDTEIQVEPGCTIAEAAVRACVDIPGPCGGAGRCGKCLVRVDGRCVSEITSDERRHLNETDLDTGLRLACQTVIQEDVDVEIVMPTSREATACILTHSSLADTDLVWDPAVTVTDRSKDGRVVMYDGQPITEIGPDERVCGIALDIGTTTVAGWLYDLEDGREIADGGVLNPQGAYGADAITRIQYACEHDNGPANLQTAVIGAVNGLISDMCGTSGLDPANVYDCTIVGNTAMMHLMLGVSPHRLGLAPYVSEIRGPVDGTASDLGISINPAGRFYHLPCIESFVGADTVGVILATGLNRRAGLNLAIDIGTNGEIVLSHDGRILVCSAAAGPALEGGELSCGMRSGSGAVDSVEIVDECVRLHTIGDAVPRGICGSGILDAIAVLRDLGVLDTTGRMVASARVGNVDIESLPGEKRAVFARSEPKDIYVTQRDVRRIQLAKGAICVGIETLLDMVSAVPADVDTVYLAGAFGNFMRPESAVKTGLLPAGFDVEQFRSVGNAAGTGARLALISRGIRQESDDIADAAEHIDLMTRPGFQDRFAESILFPE